MGNNPSDPNFVRNAQKAAQYTPGVSAPPGTGLQGPINVQGHLATPTPLPPKTLTGTVGMSSTQVRAMQQFLNNHGFQVAQDGIMGPQTKAAAAAFRANHKGGTEWSKTNGTGVHPKGGADFKSADLSPPITGVVSSPSAATPGAATDPFSELLSALLSKGGNVGTQFDPQSFGAAQAAPSIAEAASLSRQVAANPLQEAQNQSDISSWYGLDPKASGYQLSVLGRLAQAKGLDAKAATDASSNTAALAQALAGSIGGSANDGSAEVAAAGANAAGTQAAIGQQDQTYANEMNPLLAAEARGHMSTEHAANSQQLLDLQDQLAKAQGQATADRATGVAQATDKNNALAQQGFANQGNLLSTLAGLQAADPSYHVLRDQKLQAQINRINNPVAKTGGTVPKAALGSLVSQVAGIAGIGADHRLPANTSLGGVAHLVGSALQSAGIQKTDPRYQRIAQTIMGSFLDSNGQPLAVPPGWFAPNTK